jgi:uncharacterized protein (DUF488 family)
LPVTVYTIGHGTRAVHELLEMLHSAGVGRLVDVRRFPGSRRHPQFNKDGLADCLAGAGIDYDWRGEELGGRRKKAPGPSRHSALRNASFVAYADYMDTEEFRAALERLQTDAGADPPLAIMCAETLWWRCHRRHIADALQLEGIDVVHLLGVASRQAHKLHPAMRADDHGRPLYDVGASAQLALE